LAPEHERLGLLRQRVIRIRRTQAEGQHALSLARHGAHQVVVGVDDRHVAPVEDARLRVGVGLDARVAIHVIRRDIEHGRGRCPERPGGLELETRKLEDVELGHRLGEQIERRLAEVAAGKRRAPGGGRELGHERRHSALAVGARHRGDRRLRLARKELDVADDW
jgi:hypothetical protein